MIKTAYKTLGLTLILVISQLNYARFAPLSDWWTHAFVVIGVVFTLCPLLMQSIKIEQFPAVIVFLLAFSLWILLGGTISHSNQTAMFDGAGALLVMVVLAAWVFYLAAQDRESLVTCLAWVIVTGAVIQAVLGSLQVFGFAPLFRGYVLFDVNNITGAILGNIGQHNQYVHYLAWGCLAACYLYARQRLAVFVFVPVIFFLTLLMAWAASRLALAYGIGMAVLAWLWLRRSDYQPSVKRMAMAIATVVLFIAATQLFMPFINASFGRVGLHTNLVSGTERLLDAGFGARRWIEWTKAWMVFQQHPWFGVGWGGYPAQTVRLEVTAGLPKVPESWLFTQCHDLIFQLLAETGVIGTLIVIIGLVICLLPYFRKDQANNENLYLITMAMVTLTHSLFEFPLWYLPFLAGFVIVLALSPKMYPLLVLRPSLSRCFAVMVVIGGSIYAITGALAFKTLVSYNIPSKDVDTNIQQIESILQVSRNPFWSTDADMVLAHYMSATHDSLDTKLTLYEALNSYRPYPQILLNLAGLRALKGRQSASIEAIDQYIANYPDLVNDAYSVLNFRKEPELQPLINKLQVATNIYNKYRSNLDKARLATVMTVAAPVTKKPFFTFN